MLLDSVEPGADILATMGHTSTSHDTHARGSTPLSLVARYQQIRARTEQLVAPLEKEDMVVQSMPDASPTRWHLAHVSWFFEHFLLQPRLKGYRAFQPGWDYLFNSYYYSAGQMFRRPQRGLLSRPTVDEVLAYRAFIDEHILDLIEREPHDPEVSFLVQLGLHHEQQHQELILTDIKHALWLNPLRPAYRSDLDIPRGTETPQAFHEFTGGIVNIGAEGEDFYFDNETPRHRVLLQPFQLGERLVSNAEFKNFIEDGGYTRSEWWLSDGWSMVNEQAWRRPLYWSEALDSEFSLAGEIGLDPHRPVCHLSYYEADAYARWSGARLPAEAEWEHVASRQEPPGDQTGSNGLHPGSATDTGTPTQMFGDTWEWTASPYSAYPGFRPLSGSLGEYNGKFMCSQLVLRGGSCATPPGHTRPSYRNFFYPAARWQFSGIRLARDIG